MREYEQASAEAADDSWEQRSPRRDQRFALADGRRFKLDFSGADEPGDTVLAVRICGRVLKASRCDFVQLIFLIITLVFIFTIIFGAALSLI